MKAHRKLWECAVFGSGDGFECWESITVTTDKEFEILNEGLQGIPWDGSNIERLYACFFALYFADEGLYTFLEDVIEV